MKSNQSKFNHSKLEEFQLFQELMEKQRTLLSGLITVKGGRALINWGLLLFRLIASKAPSKSTVKILRHFSKECFRIARHNGLSFLVRYLKTCAIMLQQSVAHNDGVFNPRAIGNIAVSSTRRGLPRIIPAQQRLLLRKGNVQAITFWLSIFNTYRYLKCEYGENNFSTITDPGNGWEVDEETRQYIDKFWIQLSHITKKTKKELPKGEPFLSNSVSVNVTMVENLMGTSFAGIIRSVWNWRWLATRLNRPLMIEKGAALTANALVGKERERGMKLMKAMIHFTMRFLPSISAIFYGTGVSAVTKPTPPPMGRGHMVNLDPRLQHPGVAGMLAAYMKNLPASNQPMFATAPDSGVKKSGLDAYHYLRLRTPDKYRVPWVPPITEDVLKTPLGTIKYKPMFGRLVALKEAAAKIRIIAIVDPMTQWVLRPLHRWIFAILGDIPQDGTFDQIKPVDRLMKIVRQDKDKFVGSCDMSAATDRLPIKLQRAILAAKFGEKFASHWMSLLVARDYWKSFTPRRYAVGQPMGALSSWAMLALTHHFLWQWSAWRSGVVSSFKWFTEYAVLGDDSAARNRKVVDEYLRICAELGVKVNLSKSLLSKNGCVEFAKRFMTLRGDCSPVSMGELLISKVNFSVMSNWPRKRDIRLADLLYLMGYKHRTTSRVNLPLFKLGRRLRHMIIAIRSPWGSMPCKSFEEWLLLKRWNKSEGTLDPVIQLIRLIREFDDLEAKIRQTVAGNVLSTFPTTSMSFGKYAEPDSPTYITKLIRKKDPDTFRVVKDAVYEPIRVKTYDLAENLRLEVIEAKIEILRRSFHITPQEWWEYYSILLDFETRLFNLRRDTSAQEPEQPARIPSSREIVKVWNKFGPNSPFVAPYDPWDDYVPDPEIDKVLGSYNPDKFEVIDWDNYDFSAPPPPEEKPYFPKGDGNFNSFERDDATMKSGGFKPIPGFVPKDWRKI